MDDRAFYDTVVFVLSLNADDGDHPSCRDLLDIEGGGVTWCIVLSAITRGEATLHEYLSQLEQRCAAQGVEWRQVEQEHIKEAMKRSRAVKERLEQAGMQSRDIKQAFAAAWANAALLVTRDRDFFDPKDKGRRGKRGRGSSVRDLLRGELSVEPLFPADALTRLRAFPRELGS
jgi:predicted nucleic acid-binding protein